MISEEQTKRMEAEVEKWRSRTLRAPYYMDVKMLLAEMKRLKKESKRISDLYYFFLEAWDTKEKENKRLTEALEYIRDDFECDCPSYEDRCQFCVAKDTLNKNAIGEV